MSYDDLIKMCENCNAGGYNCRTILRDIAFMLSEFKKNRKLGIIDPTSRKRLADLITQMGTPGARPMELWEYGCYFRLKKDYLDMREALDTSQN